MEPEKAGAQVLSRYAEVFTALREPALAQVSDAGTRMADDASATAALHASVLDDFNRLSSAEWRAAMESSMQRLLQRARPGPVDLVREVIQPWSAELMLLLAGKTGD